MIEPIAEIRLELEADVFVARQRARDTAEALAFDTNDQVRLATAVSELARVILTSGSTALIALGIEATKHRELVVETTISPPLNFGEGPAAGGADAGRRLLDSFSIDDGPPQAISMSKALPAGNAIVGTDEVDRLRARIAASALITPLDELRAQNLELVFALEQLTARQQELIRLNDELTETNQGVVAMYGELSDELEKTNRGVVALYAELDERGLELRAANEAKSRFLASVSHELRSPLNAVIGLARLLADTSSEPLSDNQAHQVRLVEGSAREILGLVNDLLDLAAAEAGKLTPLPQPVALDELCAELIATMRSLVGEGVEFGADVAPLPPIESDPKLLGQVVRNLLSNAIKFTERGFVRLTVTPREAASGVCILVEDSGIGIPPEHQERVFEEFFQVPGSLQRKFKGTGLGLPYARRVVEALGGKLELQSEVGAGTTVTVDLPTIWAPVPRVTGAASSSEASSVEVDTVLVVDDEETFRVMLRQMLQGTARRVLEAEDGESAIDQMHRYHPDLVLLDLRMPGGGGEMVLARARVDDDLRSIPIAVITSVETGGEILNQLRPALSIVSKSELSREVLLSTIKDVLAKVQP